ncbi:MAG TPA: hypothetical protein VNM90_06360 [Haliangium sp.]|nr:hypothetical protein [Haliangium sp.]
MAGSSYEYQSEFARRHVAEGFKQALTRQLGRKFGELPDWARQRLQTASKADIERWGERVLVAGTLDDVFAD